MSQTALFVVSHDKRKAKQAFSTVTEAFEYIYAFYGLFSESAHRQNLVDLLDKSYLQINQHRINVYYN